MIIKNYKQIHDSIHGYIKISNLACKIIDTPEFQRLRYLHQLGTCHYIFPNATHTRFEHSVGTYHLAHQLLENIKENSNPIELNRCLNKIPELSNYYIRKYGDDAHHKLDDYVCELIKIAALCHDLGHGPFSHVFDDEFIPSMREHYKKEANLMEKHELRSCLILEKIINSNIELSKMIHKNDIKFIKTLIYSNHKHKGFVYQIISNNLNSIDVDKFDYITRDTYTLGQKFGFDHSRLINDAIVINNIICYPKQTYYEIANLFKTRYRLHKQIYSHKIVIAIQFMINEMMTLIEPIVKLYNSIFHIDNFCKLTDDYVLTIIKFLHQTLDNYSETNQKRINEAYRIWLKINKRDIHRFIGTIISDKPINIKSSLIYHIDPNIDKDEVLTYKSKIGFVSGTTSNPLEDLYFYDNKDATKCFKINKEEVTFLIPNTFQEYIYMIFAKDRDDYKLIDKLTKVFNILEDKIKN